MLMKKIVNLNQTVPELFDPLTSLRTNNNQSLAIRPGDLKYETVTLVGSNFAGGTAVGAGAAAGAGAAPGAPGTGLMSAMNGDFGMSSLLHSTWTAYSPGMIG